MRGIKLILVAMAAAAGVILPAKTEAKELIIMSYNVHNGVGLDRVGDAARIGEVIRRERPDVVAIQEVDSMTGRSGKTYVLGDIAKTAGMKAYYGPAIAYDGGKYGIGLLSKEEPLKVVRYKMPGREEERAMIVAEYEDYIFAATHFSLTNEDRAASAEIVKRLAKESGKPFFLAGDLNAHPDEGTIKSLSEAMRILTPTDRFTFPADEANETLDYIMVSRKPGKRVKAKSTKIIYEPTASDHRPITATVEVE